MIVEQVTWRLRVRVASVEIVAIERAITRREVGMRVLEAIIEKGSLGAVEPTLVDVEGGR